MRAYLASERPGRTMPAMDPAMVPQRSRRRGPLHVPTAMPGEAPIRVNLLSLEVVYSPERGVPREDPMPSFTQEALHLLRDPTQFKWYAIPLLGFAIYAYAAEIEKRNWSTAHRPLRLRHLLRRRRLGARPAGAPRQAQGDRRRRGDGGGGARRLRPDPRLDLIVG